MSIASIGSVSVSFFQATFSLPAASLTSPVHSAQKTAEHEHEHADRSRFKANSLVSAMMSAFQALGLGQSGAVADGSSTSSETAGAAATAGGTASVASAGDSGVADAIPAARASDGTQLVAATDTLEQAVTEFAYALFGAMQGRGHEGHRQWRREQGHHDEGDWHSSRGYNGFVQRLDRLVQSLGAATPAVTGNVDLPGSSASSVDPSTAASADVVPSASTTASQTSAAHSSRPTARLLAAFTKVMNLLQPQDSAVANETTPSMADKLKLFLGTLSQGLRGQTSVSPYSSVGSQLDVTV